MINDCFVVGTTGTYAGITTDFTRQITTLNIRVSTFKNRDLTVTSGALNTRTARVPGASIVGFTSFTSVGVGTQIASLNEIGAVDDIYKISNINDDSFILQSRFFVPPITQNIVGGSSTVGVGSNPSWIKIPNHYYADGTEVTYTASNPSFPISPLVDGVSYFVRVLDSNHVALAEDVGVAIDRNNESLLEFTSNGASVGTGLTHTFTTRSIKGFIPGTGTLGITSSSNIVTGSETQFLSDFANGDSLRIYQLVPPNQVGPGTYFETKITSIKSNTTLQVEQFIDSDDVGIGTTGLSRANYFVATRTYLLTDARAVHRPFDGGISMSSGISPNSQIVRQTRRYFRYQSGKGIQCSMAINFNPTYDVDVLSGFGTVFTIKCKFPHGISPNYISSPVSSDNQKVQISIYDRLKNALLDNPLNSTFDIASYVDDFTFTINTPEEYTTGGIGFSQYNVLNWKDSSLKAGMFDDQNGFFFKYDGVTLYAVRRASTQQLSGTCHLERGSHTVIGQETSFQSQLDINDSIVIRGQTYKVVAIDSDSAIQVQPSYRGQDSQEVVMSKVIDTEIPQNQWNIDKCDGSGTSGYNINVNKIQMIYMDYSWYGAGSIRFGFKDLTGEVIYVHEFVHNNDFTESYFRSGNLPARYEILTGNNPGFGPSLFHWGVSVMMDGRFDDDKAYLFTADSNPLPFTNGGFANSGGTRPTGATVAGSNIVTGISNLEASTLVIGENIRGGTATNANDFQLNTKITAIEVDQSSEASRFGNNFTLVLSKPVNATRAATSNFFNIDSGTSAQLRDFTPLVSIRLAPSVDNGTTGNIGFRDIINRMQLTLKSAGVLVTHDCEVRLYLNPRLSKDIFQSVGAPSLAQIYKHEVGDSFSGGISIYSFRAQGGNVSNTTTGRRTLNETSVSLEELALLGNSILGGDSVYPDGPDVLTLAIKPVDPSGISGSSPLIASSRITWAEAQA